MYATFVEKTVQVFGNPIPQRWKPLHVTRKLFFVLDDNEFPKIETQDELLGDWQLEQTPLPVNYLHGCDGIQSEFSIASD